MSIERPIDFKPVHVLNPMERKDLPPVEDMWFKLKGETSNIELTFKAPNINIPSLVKIFPVAKPLAPEVLGETTENNIQIGKIKISKKPH